MSDLIDEKLLTDYLQMIFQKANDPALNEKKWTEEEAIDLYQYAYHFYRNGKYEEAAHFFRTLTTINYRDRHYWIGLAGALKMLKRYHEAIDIYTVAAIMDNFDPFVHAHAADCCFAIGDIDRGMLALDSAEAIASGKEQYNELNSQLAAIRQAWSNKDVAKTHDKEL